MWSRFVSCTPWEGSRKRTFAPWSIPCPERKVAAEHARAAGAWQRGGGRAESLRTLHLLGSLGSGSANWISTIAQVRLHPVPHFRKHLLATEMPLFEASRVLRPATGSRRDAGVRGRPAPGRRGWSRQGVLGSFTTRPTWHRGDSGSGSWVMHSVVPLPMESPVSLFSESRAQLPLT